MRFLLRLSFHLQKGRHPTQNNFPVEIIVRAGQDAAAQQLQGTHQEITPFDACLNRTVTGGLDFALCSIPMCQDLGRLTQR